jgi:D-lyxose ketol-isomerase
MKRSEINRLISEAVGFLEEMKFKLPPFAGWTPADWRTKGAEVGEIVASKLGWDITDFGSGEFAKCGLLLFTIRNGTLDELRKPHGKIYAEKIMVVRENQITPTHFHHQKMEDIINRGGGVLNIRLWNAEADNSLSDAPVSVSVDGVRVSLPAGGTIALEPGQSVCLPQRLYHKFWGAPGRGPVLIGEVSRVNDDTVDNYFLEAISRFPMVDEDVEPTHFLVTDYATHPSVSDAGVGR